MKAMRFARFGEPAVLHLDVVADPVPGPADAVVAVRAASINPSDLGNVAGRFPYTTLPRTPGRDYSGVVVEGPEAWLGAEVWGTGDAGYRRDGSHAERILVPISSLRRKPTTLSHAQAASVGVTFMAAWLGVVSYAQLKAGETLVVIGASGGVGGAAVQIGHALGARVIGVDRQQPLPDSPAARMAEAVLTPETKDAAAIIRDVTAGRGADVVLNAIGGPTFEPSLEMLAYKGRLSVLASPGQARVEFNLLDFYHNESQLFGVDTLKHDMTASAEVLEAIAPGFEKGLYLPPVIDRMVGLGDAIEAYRAVAGGARGRVVLTPVQA
jgi:NADPH:quinone reductase